MSNYDQSCHVIFIHDDDAGKWKVLVKNADSSQDARDAFAAVVITCGMISGKLQIKHAKLDQIDPYTFEVTPAVYKPEN